MQLNRLVRVVVLTATTYLTLDSSGRAEQRGQMFITREPIANAGTLSKAALSHALAVTMLWPREEQGNEVTKWTVNYVALLDRPLGDFEAELTLWDVTKKGQAHLVRSEDQFTRQKDTRILSGRLDVSSPEFERNHKYVTRLENRHVLLGEVTFWLRGTPPKYSGKATFSDEETAK
jgi:hypothetical protein